MRRLLSCLALLLLLACPRSASARPFEVDVGARIGAGPTWLSGRHVEGQSQAGLVVGGTVLVRLATTFALQAELNLTTKGHKTSRQFISEGGVAAGSELVTTELRYLEIPLLARFRFDHRSRPAAVAQLGPTLAWRVGAQSRSQHHGFASIDGVGGFDPGVAIGFGFEARRLIVDLRYTVGVRETVRSARNHALAIGVAYAM